MNESEIEEELRNLVKKIIEVCKEKLKNEEIYPLHEPIKSWKVDKFEYAKEGVNISRHGQDTTRESWVHGYSDVTGAIELTKEFLLLDKGLGIQDSRFILTRFVNVISNQFLSNNLPDSMIEQYIIRLKKDVEKIPQKIWANVEIEGIYLEMESLQINENVYIRRTNETDFEENLRDYFYDPKFFTSNPTAILRIETIGEHEELSRQINLYLLKLRLFKVGSVFTSSYKMGSESLRNFSEGRVSSVLNLIASQKYEITESEKDKFVSFFKLIDKNLPSNFLTGTETPISIAYKRYSDAIIENTPIERKILNAMMGLEAIYLNDNLELKFKLSMRIAKFLSYFSFNPHETKKYIKEAYDIRSSYAHGSILSPEQEVRKKSLLDAILNYLRISIIYRICNNYPKDKFIEELDFSLIDKAHIELLTQVEKIKELIAINN